MPNSFADTMLNNSSNLSNRQKLSEDLHNVQRASNSFEEEMEMYEKIENEGQRKINDVLVENAKLKEKLNNVENKSIKELREENNKLKKKMNILKRKHEETLVQKQ